MMSKFLHKHPEVTYISQMLLDCNLGYWQVSYVASRNLSIWWKTQETVEATAGLCTPARLWGNPPKLTHDTAKKNESWLGHKFNILKFPVHLVLRDVPSTHIYQVPSLKLTWHLKIHPWKRRFLLKTIILRFYVSFREGIHTIHTRKSQDTKLSSLDWSLESWLLQEGWFMDGCSSVITILVLPKLYVSIAMYDRVWPYMMYTYIYIYTYIYMICSMSYIDTL